MGLFAIETELKIQLTTENGKVILIHKCRYTAKIGGDSKI